MHSIQGWGEFWSVAGAFSGINQSAYSYALGDNTFVEEISIPRQINLNANNAGAWTEFLSFFDKK